MILDGYTLFDNAVALTATRDSTNVLDLQNARDLGIGDGPTLKLFVDATSALLSAGATTLTVALSGSTDNSTYTVMAQSPAIAKAALTTGTRIWSIDMPRTVAGQSLPRYLKLVYTVAVSDFTGGSVSAGLVLDRQDVVQYSAGITIAN